MGKLHDLSRYGRCSHGRIAKPGNCADCASERDAAFRELLLAAGRRMGAGPGEQVSGVFCPGGQVVRVTMPEGDGTANENGRV
jgi:hypothetical protein